MGGPPKIGFFTPPNHPFVHRGFHEINHLFWAFSPYFWKHPDWDTPKNKLYKTNWNNFLGTARIMVEWKMTPSLGKQFPQNPWDYSKKYSMQACLPRWIKGTVSPKALPGMKLQLPRIHALIFLFYVFLVCLSLRVILCIKGANIRHHWKPSLTWVSGSVCIFQCSSCFNGWTSGKNWAGQMDSFELFGWWNIEISNDPKLGTSTNSDFCAVMDCTTTLEIQRLEALQLKTPSTGGVTQNKEKASKFTFTNCKKFDPPLEKMGTLQGTV